MDTFAGSYERSRSYIREHIFMGSRLKNRGCIITAIYRLFYVEIQIAHKLYILQKYVGHEWYALLDINGLVVFPQRASYLLPKPSHLLQ